VVTISYITIKSHFCSSINFVFRMLSHINLSSMLEYVSVVSSEDSLFSLLLNQLTGPDFLMLIALGRSMIWFSNCV